MKKILVLIVGILFLGFSAIALADSIDPDSLTLDLTVGESATITKTVTINAGTPTSSKVDVFFLTDSTGSMYGLINAVKTGANTILTTTTGLGDVAFGVGEYRDFGDAFTYRMNTDLTTNVATAQAAINVWAAAGGGDWAEANLFALNEVATGTSWRPGSARILVWFGDAPGHDPSGGVTEATATANLVANSVVVEALNVGTYGGGLDAYGQATRITAATGGTYFPTVDTGAIVTEIQNAITSVFATYGAVGLEVDGLHPNVAVSFAPMSHTGTFDRSVTRTFDFEVTFECLGEGTDVFNINALVDRGIVAVEKDTINQTDPVPEPSTIMLLMSGLFGIAILGRRKFRHGKKI